MSWLEKEKQREYHQAASLFPLMEKEEFEALKNDIAENGLREAIWLHSDGSVLDGRNRHRACIETDTPPRFRTWDGQGSLVGFVVSMNLHRRHLTSSQQAACSVEALPLLEAEARERQLATLKRGDVIPDSQKIDERETGRATQQAAQLFQTNRQYVSDAKKLKEEAPDLLEDVKKGNKTVPQARKELKKRKKDSLPAQLLPAVVAARSPLLIVGRAENMHQIEDSTIDLIITSPPYNLGSDEWPMGGQGRQPRENGIGYRDTEPESDYQQWQIACLIEMYRVARVGASLFYNHKVRQKEGAIIHPLDWLRNRDNPWIIRQEIIWDRGSTHNHSPTLFWPEDERIYWMTKDKPVLPNRSVGMSTVWRFHGPVAGTWHPAPFTEELPQRCIEAIGREGVTVLDPFAGSCTTLKAALRHGYDAIGIDTSLEYLERAAKENGWTGVKES